MNFYDKSGYLKIYVLLWGCPSDPRNSVFLLLFWNVGGGFEYPVWHVPASQTQTQVLWLPVLNPQALLWSHQSSGTHKSKPSLQQMWGSLCLALYPQVPYTHIPLQKEKRTWCSSVLLSLEDTEFTGSCRTAGKIPTRQMQMVMIPLTHCQSAQMLTSEEKTYTSEVRLSAC